MLKVIVSIYVIGILLFAGLAKASDFDIQRVQLKKQIALPVEDIHYDEQTDILTISGANHGFCVESIYANTRVIESEKRAVITVVGSDSGCPQRVLNYELPVHLGNAFSSHKNLKGEVITVKIINSQKIFEYEL